MLPVAALADELPARRRGRRAVVRSRLHARGDRDDRDGGEAALRAAVRSSSSPTPTTTTSAGSRTSRTRRSLRERAPRRRSGTAARRPDSRAAGRSGESSGRPSCGSTASWRAGDVDLGTFRVAVIDAASHGREGLAYVLLEQGILLPGDNLSAITIPLLAGSLARAREATERLLAALDRYTLRHVVPGHGPVLTPERGAADRRAGSALPRAAGRRRARGGKRGPQPGVRGRCTSTRSSRRGRARPTSRSTASTAGTRVSRCASRDRGVASALRSRPARRSRAPRRRAARV